MWMCLDLSRSVRTNASLHEHCHRRLKQTGSSENRRRVMPAFPNNVPVVKALAAHTLLAGTRRWDCAGIQRQRGSAEALHL